jgi:hypothetical protein
MLDRGDRAFRNVRIDRDLRRRRNDNGKRNTGDRWDHGSAGNVIIVRNIDLVRNIRDLRDDGNVGLIGDVRLRLGQHGFIVNANFAHNSGRGCSSGNSAGIYRDRQSWSELRSGGTDDKRIAPCVYGRAGANDPERYLSAHGFIGDDKHYPVPNHRADGDFKRYRRLLKLPSSASWTGHEKENDHPRRATDCRRCDRRISVLHACSPPGESCCRPCATTADVGRRWAGRPA